MRGRPGGSVLSCWNACGRVSRGWSLWLQAGKYLGAVMSELPERNGWSVARLGVTGRRTRRSGC